MPAGDGRTLIWLYAGAHHVDWGEIGLRIGRQLDAIQVLRRVRGGAGCGGFVAPGGAF